MTMKILSIIVPVYNAEKYISCCVQSLLEQDIPLSDYEILLINDGSTDNSLRIVEKFEREHPQVKVVSQCNQGVSATRNRGLEIAEGKYILFVDADDYIEPFSINKIIVKAEENKLDLCFFRFGMEYENGGIELCGERSFKINSIYTGSYVVTHGVNISSIWNTLYLSSRLRALNLKFSVGIVQEDVEFCMKLYPRCARVMFTDEVIYHYRRYGDSLTRNVSMEDVKAQFLSNLQIAENIFNYIRTENVEEAVKVAYSKRMNSMLVSQIMRLWGLRQKKHREFMRQYLLLSKQKGLYPIGHETMSWRTCLLTYVVDTKLFEYMYF